MVAAVLMHVLPLHAGCYVENGWWNIHAVVTGQQVVIVLCAQCYILQY